MARNWNIGLRYRDEEMRQVQECRDVYTHVYFRNVVFERPLTSENGKPFHSICFQ